MHESELCWLSGIWKAETMTERECGAWTRHPRWWGRILDLGMWGHIEHDCGVLRPGFGVCHASSHRCMNCGLVWPLAAFERATVRIAGLRDRGKL